MDEELVRVRFDLSYEGTAFAGWAMQPGQRTVEGTLGDGLSMILRTPGVRLTVAGRTDSGVHARGQVAHADIARSAFALVPGRSDRPPEQAMISRLRGVLPDDIVVHSVAVVPEAFDARFSALWRRYQYRIADHISSQDPMRRRTVLWHRRLLDVSAMHDAAQLLCGERDFLAYCRPRKGSSTIRTLFDFNWERITTGPDTGLVVATVRADAFCHNMVRALVGGSVVVGEGRENVQWTRDVLDARKRHPHVAVMPACGLTLEEVSYPVDAELASRAKVTRVRREPLVQ